MNKKKTGEKKIKQTKSAKTKKERHSCLDFFAGSGLVAEGLREYFTTVWANDISEKKAAVYCANHNPAVFHLGPVEEIRGADLPEAVLSWGSFPCQDLSLAGNMGGLSSARSGLVWHWLRIMDEMPVRPPLAVAENVTGLVSAAGGAHYRILHRALAERGYRVGALMLDAARWEPQSRKRIFVVAVDNRVPVGDLETGGPSWCHSAPVIRAARDLEGWTWWRLPLPGDQRRTLETIIDPAAPCDEPLKRDRLLSLIPEHHWEKLKKAEGNGFRVFPGYKRIRNGRQVLELRFDGLAGCLRTPEGGSSRQFLVMRHNGEFRTRLLSVAEAAALMGVRQGYQIPGGYNDGYKAMGDAVAVPVTRYLARFLLAPLAEKISQEGF